MYLLSNVSQEDAYTIAALIVSESQKTLIILDRALKLHLKNCPKEVQWRAQTASLVDMLARHLAPYASVAGLRHTIDMATNHLQQRIQDHIDDDSFENSWKFDKE